MTVNWLQRFRPPCASTARFSRSFIGTLYLQTRRGIARVSSPLGAVGERVSKHRVTALGLFLDSLVLNDIPVLKQDTVFHTDNICRNPVHRQPDAREPAMNDDEVSLGYDYSGLIFERWRDALDQVEETVTARLNVRAVLNVVGRPEALRCRIISLIKQVSKASSTMALLFSAFESFTVISAFPRSCWLLISGVSQTRAAAMQGSVPSNH